MQIDLLTIGDSSIDQFMQVENGGADEKQGEICFIHGTKIPVNSFETSIAGNALNVSVGTQKLGVKTALYTEIGDDQNAQRILEELKAYGIDTTYCIKNIGTLTDVHPIIVYKQERTIFIYHAKRTHKVLNWPKPKWLYYSSVGKDFEKFQNELVSYLNQNPSVVVAFNPGTYHLKTGLSSLKNFLEVTDILFLNKDETIELVGKGDIKELHEKLQKYGPKVTVITDGNKGASAYDGKNLVEVPVFEETKPVVDKTGAGDAFSSGFLAAIINNKPLTEAVKWGVINSSGVIREIGAINGLRTKTEIESLMR
jgi:sugar/nucleoside kinase (ribokinase family)